VASAGRGQRLHGTDITRFVRSFPRSAPRPENPAHNRSWSGYISRRPPNGLKGSTCASWEEGKRPGQPVLAPSGLGWPSGRSSQAMNRRWGGFPSGRLSQMATTVGGGSHRGGKPFVPMAANCPAGGTAQKHTLPGSLPCSRCQKGPKPDKAHAALQGERVILQFKRPAKSVPQYQAKRQSYPSPSTIPNPARGAAGKPPRQSGTRCPSTTRPAREKQKAGGDCSVRKSDLEVFRGPGRGLASQLEAQPQTGPDEH